MTYKLPDEPTHLDIQKARVELGLSVVDMARMLGHGELQQKRLETAPNVKNRRTAQAYTIRLLRAYLDGYRPKDWPEQSKPGLAAKRLAEQQPITAQK